MPRQKNTRSTNIYWLYDMRSETVAEYGPEGFAFYCGKTVGKIKYRFNAHRSAVVTHPDRPVSAYLARCGECVRVGLIEIVSVENDWIAREQHWIAILRALNPNCANVSIGGSGATGLIQSAKQRAITSARHRGKVTSEETKAKMRESHKGRAPLSPELIAQISAKLRGRKLSPEHTAKLTAAWQLWYAAQIQLSAHIPVAAPISKPIKLQHPVRATPTWVRKRKQSPEARAKMSAAHQRRRAALQVAISPTS